MTWTDVHQHKHFPCLDTRKRTQQGLHPPPPSSRSRHSGLTWSPIFGLTLYPNSALMPPAHSSLHTLMRRGCMPLPTEATSTSLSVSRMVPPACNQKRVPNKRPPSCIPMASGRRSLHNSNAEVLASTGRLSSTRSRQAEHWPSGPRRHLTTLRLTAVQSYYPLHPAQTAATTCWSRSGTTHLLRLGPQLRLHDCKHPLNSNGHPNGRHLLATEHANQLVIPARNRDEGGERRRQDETARARSQSV